MESALFITWSQLAASRRQASSRESWRCLPSDVRGAGSPPDLNARSTISSRPVNCEMPEEVVTALQVRV